MVRYSGCGPTVAELIEALKKVEQTAVVKIYDPDGIDEIGDFFPISGFTHDHKEVKLYCDES